MVYDNKTIALTYLRGWFILDVFTCIPFDIIFAAIAAAAAFDISPSTFQLLRMLRLVKLMRVLRASRIIGRWQDHVGFSYALISLLQVD